MQTKRLIILICTHNRSELLGKVIHSLNVALRPESWDVSILVAANACTDGTHTFLDDYRRKQSQQTWLKLEWFEVATPGKSYALNAAIPRVKASDIVAFVDDDHRVDTRYIEQICRAADSYPDISIFCGRIIPDWDGSEPTWVHDDGSYRIFPLPVPRYDLGDHAKPVTASVGPIPGGGNLALRGHIFDLAGCFLTELGPHGHDLRGGEDSEFVIRALSRGALLQYIPGILQYHYVDLERLAIPYLIRKAYQRTRSTARIKHTSNVIPLYVWRKIADYGWNTIFSMSWTKRRFYLVRCAAALGEMRGIKDAIEQHRSPLHRDKCPYIVKLLGVTGVIGGFIMMGTIGWSRWPLLWPAFFVALLGTLGLTTKSLIDFSQTGPNIRSEILAHYKTYTFWAVGRLAFWAFFLLFLMSVSGIMIFAAVCIYFNRSYSDLYAMAAAVLGIAAATCLQFTRKLLYNPGLLTASMHYRASRLYPLWNLLNPTKLRIAQGIISSAVLLTILGASWKLAQAHMTPELLSLGASLFFFSGLIVWSSRLPVASQPRNKHTSQKPNIVMIGSDTLRADRIRPDLTPNICKLVSRGTNFTQCYVPCARTAPSLMSLFSGVWPHTHGIRDNFVADSEARLPLSALPKWLSEMGYKSAAVSDWCGADMGKFDFGFDHVDLPEDQWNLKYLIRQGPKDIRLFLSLFMHNNLGRLLIPELYYLGGVPLTSQIGKRARNFVSRLAENQQPFLLNVFYSTTHPPFASEYPWYTRHAEPSYSGPSKFAMARLNDPFEIIRRQGEPREEFDLDQILHLYDGCVAQFDHEIGLMMKHIDECGLIDNTIIVVYSDHGMEFFEHETWGQGNSAVGDVSPRIPLIIIDPRRTNAHTVTDIVRSIDIAPTLVDLAGGSPPISVEGVSLIPLMDNPSLSLNLCAFNETGIWITDIPGMPESHLRYPGLLEIVEIPDIASGTLAIKPEYKDIIIKAKDRMVRQGRWKLVYQPTLEGYLLKLFDLESDPQCRNNLSHSEPEITRQLWKTLNDWLARDSSVKIQS